MKRATGVGVAAGGACMLFVMLGVAGAAIAFGWVGTGADGRPDLTGWLRLELLAGSAAGWLAGRVSRRVARDVRAPAALAALVAVVGVLEAVLILDATTSEEVTAAVLLVISAPIVAAGAVLFGGLQRSDGKRLFAGARRASDCRGDEFDWRGLAGYGVSGLVLFTAAGIALLVLPDLAPGPRSAVVASALTLDFTVAVPALVYVLLVRTRRLPWIAIVPAFVVGYAVAAATIPHDQRALLEVLKYVVVPLELGLVAYLAVRARRALAGLEREDDGDFAARFRAAARDALGARVPADILTTEIAILYHAFRPGRPSPHGADPDAFTPHREVGYAGVVLGLVMALVVETVALHLLVSQWSAAAWALSFLSAYAVVWLVGDFRALGARPTTLSPTRLRLRVGLRWEMDIPLEQIVEVEAVAPGSERTARDALSLSVIGAPKLRLRLFAPVEVTGMYGILRKTDEVLLRVDDAETLCRRLAELAGGGKPRF